MSPLVSRQVSQQAGPRSESSWLEGMISQQDFVFLVKSAADWEAAAANSNSNHRSNIMRLKRESIQFRGGNFR